MSTISIKESFMKSFKIILLGVIVPMLAGCNTSKPKKNGQRYVVKMLTINGVTRLGAEGLSFEEFDNLNINRPLVPGDVISIQRTSDMTIVNAVVESAFDHGTYCITVHKSMNPGYLEGPGAPYLDSYTLSIGRDIQPGYVVSGSRFDKNGNKVYYSSFPYEVRRNKNTNLVINRDSSTTWLSSYDDYTEFYAIFKKEDIVLEWNCYFVIYPRAILSYNPMEK